jgi:hypothetical protein
MTISSQSPSRLRSPAETPLAVAAGLAAALHFLGEGYYQLRWGQPFLALFSDIIAVTLMGFAAIASLRARPASGAGILAAAWGFEFCLAYRAATERIEWRKALGAATNGEPDVILPLLVFFAVAAACFFFLSLRIVWAQMSANRHAGEGVR